MEVLDRVLIPDLIPIIEAYYEAPLNRRLLMAHLQWLGCIAEEHVESSYSVIELVSGAVCLRRAIAWHDDIPSSVIRRSIYILNPETTDYPEVEESPRVI
jgi:hypothetical protein